MSLTFDHVNQTISTPQDVPLTFTDPAGLVLPAAPTSGDLNITNGTTAFIIDSPISDYTDLKDSAGDPVTISFDSRLHFRHNDTWRAALNQDDIQLLKNNADFEISDRFDDIDDRIVDLEAIDIIPYGIIVAWNDIVIPAGWAICNGLTVNGKKTPDLRDRFIYGATNTKGSGGNLGDHPSQTTDLNIDHYGGSPTHKLHKLQMPAHKHVIPWGEKTSLDAPYGYWKSDQYGTNSGADTDNYHRWSSPAGKNRPHNNLPPFYSLAFIMLVG